MKIDKKKFGLLSLDIEKYTRIGSLELQKGNLSQACDAFEFAYKRALNLDEGFTERACALNVGAVYIALGQPLRGLEFLQKAVPPMGKRDNRSNGDLYYNFGLGYETLNNAAEAIKYYELALDEYKSEHRIDWNVVADVASRNAVLNINLRKHVQAAKNYAEITLACKSLNVREKQAQALGNQATQLILAGDNESATKMADEALELSYSLNGSNVLGKLYNQIGLVYTQCKLFPKAATCFEMALPLTRGYHGNQAVEAVVMQNLGAAYNSLGSYQQAVNFHENAATLHGQTGNRRGQAECFMNLAFAFSQLTDHPNAGDAYLHAFQAAKDSGDKHCQWQALEGLAAVAFLKKDIEKSVSYYKQALSTLSMTENDPVAQERIVGKLTDCLEHKVSSSPNDRPKSAPVNPTIIVRQPSTPAGTQLSNTAPELHRSSPREQRRRSSLELYNNDNTEQLHLGIGEYSEETDNSLVDLSLIKMYKDMDESEDERKEEKEKRRKQLRNSRTSSPRKSRQMQNGYSRKISTDSSGSSSERKKRVSRRKPNHQEYKYKEYSNNRTVSPSHAHRRTSQAPLLRDDDYDTEEEWVNNMKEIYGSSDSDSFAEYEERVRPPTVPPPSLASIKRRKREAELSQISESDEDDKQAVKQQMRELMVYGEVPDSRDDKQTREHSGLQRSGYSAQNEHDPRYAKATNKGTQANESRRQTSLYSEDSDSDTDARTNQEIRTYNKSHTGNGSQKRNTYSDAHRRTVGRRPTTESCSKRTLGLQLEETDRSEDEDEDEDEDENEDEEYYRGRRAPKLPDSPPPDTLKGTYETPQKFLGSKNYFRKANTVEESEDDEDEDDEEESDDPDETQKNTMDGTLYTSIKPADHNDKRQPEPSGNLPPEVPKKMTRGERDIVMFEHQRKVNEQAKKVPIPQKTNNQSKTCIVM